MEIKNPDDFKKLYKEDPGFAMGLIFENIEEMKKQCACRLEHCTAKIKKARMKNIAIQSGSGLIGGFLAWIATKLSAGP